MDYQEGERSKIMDFIDEGGPSRPICAPGFSVCAGCFADLRGGIHKDGCRFDLTKQLITSKMVQREISLYYHNIGLKVLHGGKLNESGPQGNEPKIPGGMGPDF